MAANSPPITASRHATVQFGRYTYSSVNASTVSGSDTSASSHSTIDVDGAAPVNASDCVNRYDEIDRLTPNSSGPSVISAQYASTRCANGRGLRTRQIR